MSPPKSKSDFFVAGGPLRTNAPSYVKRPADDELFERAVAGEFSYVLTPRQMGKSSLMNRTAKRLEEEGTQSIRVDLTSIGSNVTEETWYLGLITELTRQLRIGIDPEVWWQENAWLGSVQRFITFLRDVVLTKIEDRVVVFIDEIDTTLRLNFSDDFFAAIRFIYNARDEDPIFERLNFILLGVASPADLIKDNTRTPFNIGEGVNIQDFNLNDTSVLEAGLESIYPGQGESIFTHIYHWTNGHPYLTQRLCKEVSKNRRGIWTTERIDKLVRKSFRLEKGYTEPNLQFIQDKILTHPQHQQLLALYGDIHKGKKISDNPQSLLQTQLKLSGLIKAENEYLIVRNKIYQQVFSLDWINEHKQRDWNRIITYAAVALTVVVIVLSGSVFWYNLVRIPDLVQEAKLNFYQAGNSPEEQTKSIAELFELQGLFGTPDYDNEARDLFFGLSGNEQDAIFNGENEKVVVVIKGLYTSLAEVNGVPPNDWLLNKMSQALVELDEPELQEEIDSWLEGRRLARQNQYNDALNAYGNAIKLNGDNPATRYERAVVLIELSQYQPALNDLDHVLAIAGRSLIPTPTLSPTNSAISTNTPIPFPTSTSTVTANSVTNPTPSVDSADMSIDTNENSAPIVTGPPTPVKIISEFATANQIINAVRDLISDNPELLRQLSKASDTEYVNLSEFGLVPTLADDALIEISEDIGGPSIRIRGTELWPQNNCGGTVELESIVEKVMPIEHILEIDGDFRVTSDGMINIDGTLVSLGPTIAARYGKLYGTESEYSRSITLRASPGANLEHFITLFEVLQTGDARVLVNGNEYIIPFTFRDDVGITLIQSQNVGCPIDEVSSTPSEPSATSTSIP